MAHLSLPLSLLKHTDKMLSNVLLRSLQHRTFSWKQNVGAVAPGVGQLLLSHQPGAPNYAASARRSCSSGGQEITERLWSVYNETKRQTEGMDSVIIITHSSSIHSITHSTAAELLLSYNDPVMTNVYSN